RKEPTPQASAKSARQSLWAITIHGYKAGGTSKATYYSRLVLIFPPNSTSAERSNSSPNRFGKKLRRSRMSYAKSHSPFSPIYQQRTPARHRRSPLSQSVSPIDTWAFPNAKARLAAASTSYSNQP